MALTVDTLEYFNMGSLSMVTANVDFDSSYPTGGESLTAATLGLSNIKRMFVENNSGYIFEYDYTNSKLKAYTPLPASTGTMAVKDSDTAASAGVAVYFDEDGTAGSRFQFVSPTNADGSDACVSVSAAAAAEVANTTNLSAVTDVKIMALGTM